ncbi:MULTISPECIES: glycosyltransferase [unclassified Clostridium]|uniref:glycosyltransferase n=1 Tax=unclassified Clostridium TaxID=2614128 RepID=UPI0011060D0E|nr:MULTISPECIES: glycosyltransferase [unclassified Clostridium]
MKKKIAIIIQKLNGGGAERAASNLSIFLGERYEVHIIVFDGAQISYPVEGKIHDLNLPPMHSLWGKLRVLFKRIKKVKCIKAKENIVCSISLMDGANLVNVLSRKRDRVISSVRVHMSTSRLKKGWISRQLQIQFMRFIAKRSDQVVCVAQDVADDLRSNFGVPEKKLATVYNVCDGNMLFDLAGGQRINLGSQSVITMGRMTTQKGQWHLIRAFKKVIQTQPQATLYLLGEGELEKEQQQLAKDLGIAEQVKFMGYIQSPHAYIVGATLFVLPSNFEGMSNVLLEALGCGKACIACDCHSGSREVLSPGCATPTVYKQLEYAPFGVLTPVCGYGQRNATEPLTREEEMLAEGIIRLLEDEPLRKHYETKGFERVRDFSPEAILREWEKVIEA